MNSNWVILSLICIILIYFICKNTKNSMIGINNGLNAEDVKLIRKYSPLLVFTKSEKYYPSNINYILANTVPLSNHPPNGYTATTKEIYNKFGEDLDYFHGFDGKDGRKKINETQIYALVFPKVGKDGNPTANSINELNKCKPDESVLKDKDFTIAYFIFYPFNLGKSIPLLFGKYYGNHVSDIESYLIDFKSGKPQTILIGFHEWDICVAWSPDTDLTSLGDKAKDCIKTKSFKKADDGGNESETGTHPILYVALGSHGLNYESGRKYYKPAIGLNDYYGGDGEKLQTWKNNGTVVATYLDWNKTLKELKMVDDSSPWKDIRLHQIKRWGNTPFGCLPLGIGECRNNYGPHQIIHPGGLVKPETRNLGGYINKYYEQLGTQTCTP